MFLKILRCFHLGLFNVLVSLVIIWLFNDAPFATCNNKTSQELSNVSIITPVDDNVTSRVVERIEDITNRLDDNITSHLQERSEETTNRTDDNITSPLPGSSENTTNRTDDNITSPLPGSSKDTTNRTNDNITSHLPGSSEDTNNKTYHTLYNLHSNCTVNDIGNLTDIKAVAMECLCKSNSFHNTSCNYTMMNCSAETGCKGTCNAEGNSSLKEADGFNITLCKIITDEINQTIFFVRKVDYKKLFCKCVVENEISVDSCYEASVGTVEGIVIEISNEHKNFTQTVQNCLTTEFLNFTDNNSSSTTLNHSVNQSLEAVVSDSVKTFLGDSCHNDTICMQYIENAICINGSCICDDGYLQFDNSTCLLRKLSDRCNFTIDCSQIDGSDCLNASCQCLPQYIPTGNTTCSLRHIGDECDVTEDCSFIQNSHCANSTCTCLQRFEYNGESCRERPLGGLCFDDVGCSSVLNGACFGGFCECRIGYMKADNFTCNMRQINDYCDVTLDCISVIPDSFCLNGQCSCFGGYKSDTTNDTIKCVPREIDDLCNETLDCSLSIQNSHCENSQCTCLPGFFTRDKTSCERRRINHGSCDIDDDCIYAVNHSFCFNATCSCELGYSEHEIGTLCKPKMINEECISELDCNISINNSVCKSGSCQCSLGHIAENENSVCRLRNIGDSCRTHSHCSYAVDFSTCSNSSCTCLDGFKSIIDGRFCIKRKIEDSCLEDKDCAAAIEYSLCTNQTCSCIEGFDGIRNGTTCVKRPRYIGDMCYYSSHCMFVDPVAECSDVCQCPTKYFPSKERDSCIRFPETIGEQCSKHYQCEVAVSNSHCGHDDTCICNDMFFTDRNGSQCRKYPTFIHERCLIDDHCQNLPRTHCYNQTCECKYKYFPSSDRVSCLPRERVDIPQATNIWLGALCNIYEENPCPNWNITSQWCASINGRVNNRCQCKPGFSNEYNAGECHEVQSYFIRVNITEELGCYNKDSDQPRCYVFSPFEFIKQYSNNVTRKFRDMKLRLQILGFDNAFNSSELWYRFVSTSFINMTRSTDGLQVGALINIKEDYYNKFKASDISKALITVLERKNGVLGTSLLKIGKPYKENIYVDDFNECLDWNGQANDCSQNAWCINTYGSFMCSCLSDYEDNSLDTEEKPGRKCEPIKEKVRTSSACSDGKCETNWTWMGLSLSLLLIMLIGFLAHEIYAKRQEIIKSDPVYVPVKGKQKQRKTDTTSTTDKDILTESEKLDVEEGVKDEPPTYTEEP